MRSGALFYTDEGDGTVWKTVGTTHTLLATGQGQPHAIAAAHTGTSDQALAWVNRASGEVVILQSP